MKDSIKRQLPEFSMFSNGFRGHRRSEEKQKHLHIAFLDIILLNILSISRMSSPLLDLCATTLQLLMFSCHGLSQAPASYFARQEAFEKTKIFLLSACLKSSKTLERSPTSEVESADLRISAISRDLPIAFAWISCERAYRSNTLFWSWGLVITPGAVLFLVGMV